VPTALVFAAAPLQPTPRLRARLAELDRPYVVAADNGATTALAFGYQPDVVIGDLDSLAAGTLAELARRGVPIETYPRDKNATDGQLAIQRALEAQPTAVWLLGFLGGARLDQSIATIALLASLELPVMVLDELNECVLLRPRTAQTWRPEPAEVISLIPWGGDVANVTTRGLRWHLRGETLLVGDTRGVSNEPVSDEVSVSIGSGQLLVTRHFPR
jgi:thiamine pyrophosphokinase